MKNPILAVLFFVAVALQAADRSPTFGRLPFGASKNVLDLQYPDLIYPKRVETKMNTCPRVVTVAVIDTGIDYTHPDLVNGLATNEKEMGAVCKDNICTNRAVDRQDNDQDGYTDNSIGWDFVHDVKQPFDTHGHGSHISGMILGIARGTAAIFPDGESQRGWQTKSYIPAGCVPDVRILPLKYYDNGGAGYNNLSNTVRAIEYAVSKGVDIINYSGGGADPAASERQAIGIANAKGILVVAAAGNDGRNNDRRPYYPASYGFESTISVGSVNQFKRLMPSSNFGKTVHVAAPGYMVQSTLPGGRYGTMSGSSQATAYVSGVAALLMSMEPTKDYKKVRDVIFQTSSAMKLNETKQLLQYGIVDIEAAVKKLAK